MDVGVALPQMAPGLDRDRFLAWCRILDDSRCSSISAGERITFDNLDGFTLLAAGGRRHRAGAHPVQRRRRALAPHAAPGDRR